MSCAESTPRLKKPARFATLTARSLAEWSDVTAADVSTSSLLNFRSDRAKAGCRRSCRPATTTAAPTTPAAPPTPAACGPPGNGAPDPCGAHNHRGAHDPSASNGLFSRDLEQKRPVFLQYTQCSDYRETTHTWLGGGGFLGAVGVLERGAMVMVWFHVALCVESYAFHLGTSWAIMILQTCTKMKRVEIV